MLPRWVPKNELVKVNSFYSVNYKTVNLGGWALGGVHIVLLNDQNIMLVVVAFYLLATLLMTKIVVSTEFY